MTAMGDTSCLEVFTRIRGLGLLEPFGELHISQDIVHEHETTAPTEAHAYLLEAINTGRILISISGAAHISIPRRHNLSPVDLAGLMWAKKTGDWLLVDDQEVCEVARQNQLRFLDVPGIIRALAESKLLTAKQVKQVAAKVHLDADRELSDRDQRDFGLS